MGSRTQWKRFTEIGKCDNISSICFVLTIQFDNLIKTPGKSRLLFKNLNFCLNWCVTTMLIMVFYSFVKKCSNAFWLKQKETKTSQSALLWLSYWTSSPYNENSVKLKVDKKKNKEKPQKGQYYPATYIVNANVCRLIQFS